MLSPKEVKNINLSSEEVFRFFVNRNPQQHLTNNLTHIFLRPHVLDLADSLVSINNESKTIQKSIEARILELQGSIIDKFVDDKNFDPELKDYDNLIRGIESDSVNKISKLKSIIEGFTNSEKFVSSLERLKLKNFRNFIKWISAISDKKLNLNNSTSKINEIFGKSPENLVASTEFQQDKSNVYNSILLLGFMDSYDPVINNNLFTLAKIINFIEMMGNNDPSVRSNDEIPNPLDSEIVIPSEIFEKDVSTIGYRGFRNFVLEKNKIKKLFYQLNKLRNAKRELSNVQPAQLKFIVMRDHQNNNSEVQQPSKISQSDDEDNTSGDGFFDLILSKDAVENLSSTTKTLLNEESIPMDNVSVVRIIPRIDKKIMDTTNILHSKIGREAFKPSEKIIDSINKDLLDRKSGSGIPSSGPTGPDAEAGFHAPDRQRYPPFVSGIGDLKKVKEKLIETKFGEIAHIQNVLRGEKIVREHRKLNRVEETIISEEKTTEDISNYLESTERFELQKISKEIIEKENTFDFGVNVSAGYGPFFQISSYLDVGIASSTQDANESSSTYAKNVVEKSVSKIQSIIREKRIRKLLQEIEETNTHTLDNTTGPDNLHGIYQYVNKICCGELYVYGKRLLLEFNIMQPSMFYKEIFRQNVESAINLKNASKVLPEEPEVFTETPDDIDEANYTLIASRYGAEVNPPPALYLCKTSTIKQDQFVKTEDVETEQVRNYVAERVVALPEGYEFRGFQWKFRMNGGDNRNISVRVLPSPLEFYDQFGIYWEGEVGFIVRASDVNVYAVIVSMYLGRSERLFKKWQLETWTKINNEYKQQKSLYESKLSELAISQGIQIVGSNPLFNRETEKTELKKGAIMMLTEHDLNLYSTYYDVSFKNFDYVYPYMYFNRQKNLGKQVRFFEQAIEWHNMLYVFYPYFWGRHFDWVEDLFRNDVDPLFNNFLKAGSARVVVPVRPGFEKAVLLFIKTRSIIWEGKDVPTVNDPMYVDIVEEMKEKLDILNYDGILKDSWKYLVPTTLLYLRNNDLSDSEENLPRSGERCEEVNADNNNIPRPEG